MEKRINAGIVCVNNNMGLFNNFKSSEADILNNKKIGVVYVNDFPQGDGKYISITEHSGKDSPDVDFQISSRIHLRITYIVSSEKITGVEFSKVNGDKVEKINFTTLDFERIIQLLSLFSEMDLKSVINKSVVLDQSIIGDSNKLVNFLQLVASDPQGKGKIAEVAKNYNLLKLGDIDDIVNRKEAVLLFEKILNNDVEFENYKTELNIGKNEEVWQRFFSQNFWILGSDFVEILDERRIDVDNITDYLLKSFDGFVDIIELKLPSAPVWTSECIPRSELTSALMQCSRYILQTERKIDSVEFQKKIKNIPIIKPRITLIYGRSNDWTDEQKESYRVLNSSYHNLNIITYDHLLERAKRLVGIVSVEENNEEVDDIPF